MKIQELEFNDDTSVLTFLPEDSSGYGKVSCSYKNLILEIVFEHNCNKSGKEMLGKIEFDYCVSFFVVDQNCFEHTRPPHEDRIYSISPIVSAGRSFNGYAVCFSNSRRTYVVYAEKFEIS